MSNVDESLNIAKQVYDGVQKVLMACNHASNGHLPLEKELPVEIFRYMMFLATRDNSVSWDECFVIGKLMGQTSNVTPEIVKASADSLLHEMPDYQNIPPKSLQMVLEFEKKYKQIVATLVEGSEIRSLSEMIISLFKHMGDVMIHIDGDVSMEEFKSHNQYVQMMKEYAENHGETAHNSLLKPQQTAGNSSKVIQDDELLEQAIALVVANKQATTSLIQRHFRIGYTRANRIIDAMEGLGVIGTCAGGSSKEILMTYEEAMSALKAFRIANPMADDESENAMTIVKPSDNAKNEDLQSLLDELNSLIGLSAVKNEVNSLINIVKMRKAREQKGLKNAPMSLHLVFTGNPGTGKTTVARLLGKIYYHLGILSKGHLEEVDRSGLVGGYVGQTAIKTQEVIQKSLGGILFIDEAYALANKGENDYGNEAIDTLLKAMEDHRDDLILIVAGYPDKMEGFLQSNPGLPSRFNKRIFFADYTPENLVDIFKLCCRQSNYQVGDGVDTFLCEFFTKHYQARDENFANGRFARNFFEKTIETQANRLASSIDNASAEDLQLLTIEDVKRAAG